MVFESFSALLTMEGHGGYVWFCYAVFVVTISVLLWQPVAAKRKFMQQQLANLRREQAAAGREGKV